VSVGFDPLEAVRAAVTIVCEVEPEGLTESSRFDDLGADSLARVSIADLVEARAAEADLELRIDDHSLSRMTTLADLADYVTRHLVAREPARAAS
jgi:acyl carrier protein